MKPPEGTISTAAYDSLGDYRYSLNRRWANDRPVVFVMLNPSTATEHINDPTVAKCQRHAELWGFGALTVVNIFALRSTDPNRLYCVEDPIGPDNDLWIGKAIREASLVVAAWGNHGVLNGRGDVVRKMLKDEQNMRDSLSVKCFRITKQGQPEHPLYQKLAAELQSF